MPAQKRHPTKYPGVFYIMGTSAATGKPDKIFYIDYRKDGKRIQEKAGRQSEDMTPARASRRRADKIKGRLLSNKAQREADEAAKKAEENKWTVDKLWTEYKGGRKPGKGLSTDSGRYDKYLKKPFGEKEPHEIQSLDVERIKRRLLKKKSPQTVKHVLNLFTWIINFGVKSGLCSGLTFHVKKPAVDNAKTEDLTKSQLKKLLEAIDADTHDQAGNMMLMALYCGLRRGEMFRLQWRHCNFEKGFMTLVDTKGGKDQKIPLNDPTKKLLEKIARKKGSNYVFPGRGGKQRTDINKALAEIKRKAGLPSSFRSLHGLRHVFASQLASSGQVDMYVLQKLLTHKDPRMTQRYAHLRDETLKKASQVAGDIIKGLAAEKTDENSVKLEDHK
jgi:integrase